MSTKQKVLELLENNREEALSGQDMADTLQVSRTAIWKAIQALKNEGYDIESTTKKGYILTKKSDVLNAGTLQQELNFVSFVPDLEIRVFSTIDSTNAEAKRILHQGTQKDTLILADEQTAGRGRLGRAFLSPAKTGLYMSLILHELPQSADVTLLTTVAAVAVCRAIETLTDKKPQIKWVNDIFLDGQKICGILTEGVIDLETQSIQSIVLGIGLNLSLQEKEIPVEWKKIVGALFTESQKQKAGLTRNLFAAEIIKEFYQLKSEMQNKEYLDEYRERCFVLKRKVSFTRNNEYIEGKAIAIDDTGGLVVRLEDGSETTISYGEISVKVQEQESNER